MDQSTPRTGPPASGPPDDATSLVRTIGRYHLVDELGRGAMGVVYRGFDPIIGRTVALKTIAFTDNDSETRDLRARLYREAGAAGTLNHPNIVTIYDIIEEGGTSAVAMEFIEGRTLGDIITEQGPMPVEEAVRVFEQIASALDYAGAKGIIHRDIKPANIMVTTSGIAKVADFGVARMARSTMTQHGMIMGSPSYMSPEQIRGQQLDGRSDMFSATVVLYEMLTGQRPFAGDDLASTMYRIIHEPPVPVGQYNTNIGPEINAVFEKAFAKEASDRYANGAALVAAVREALLPRAGGLALTVQPATVPTRGGAATTRVAAGEVKAATAQAEPVKGKAAFPWPMAAGLGVLLLGAAGGAVWLTSRGESSQSGQAAAPSATSGASAPGTVAAAPGPPAASVAPTASVPPPAPAPPPTPQASVLVRYQGQPFPVNISANGKPAGRATRAGASLSVPAGAVRLQATSPEAFLTRDFGSITLAEGAQHTLLMPDVTGVSIKVIGDLFEGLQVTLDGRRVPGSYPYQLPHVTVGQHRIQFRWSAGQLAGRQIARSITLDPGGKVYQIIASPANDQVEVRRLR